MTTNRNNPQDSTWNSFEEQEEVALTKFSKVKPNPLITFNDVPEGEIVVFPDSFQFY